MTAAGGGCWIGNRSSECICAHRCLPSFVHRFLGCCSLLVWRRLQLGFRVGSEELDDILKRIGGDDKLIQFEEFEAVSQGGGGGGGDGGPDGAATTTSSCLAPLVRRTVSSSTSLLCCPAWLLLLLLLQAILYFLTEHAKQPHPATPAAGAAGATASKAHVAAARGDAAGQSLLASADHASEASDGEQRVDDLSSHAHVAVASALMTAPCRRLSPCRGGGRRGGGRRGGHGQQDALPGESQHRRQQRCCRRAVGIVTTSAC